MLYQTDNAEQRALEPHTAGATRWRMSLCAEMDYPEQGWKSCRKNLSCLFLFLAENGDKTLLFTVVCHLCPKMKTRMEKIFIWTFRTIKNIGSKIGQRISSVVGCSELFVWTRWHVPRGAGPTFFWHICMEVIGDVPCGDTLALASGGELRG